MAGKVLTNSREIIRRLSASGFSLVSARGSHHKYKHADEAGWSFQDDE